MSTCVEPQEPQPEPELDETVIPAPKDTATEDNPGNEVHNAKSLIVSQPANFAEQVGRCDQAATTQP